MNRIQATLMLTLALGAGLVRGALSARVLVPGQASAQDPSQEKRAILGAEFRLVDGQGKTRAVLGLNQGSGEPGLWLMDREGRVRASLILDRKQQPALFLVDSIERIRAELRVERGRVSDEEYASLVFRDVDQHVRTQLMPGMAFLRGRSSSQGQLELSTYFLRLKGEDGKVLWGAPRR